MATRNSFTSLLFSVFAVSLGCSQIAYSASATCSLLTQNQVSAILGVSVGAGNPISDTGCSWQSTGAKSVMVTVSMQSDKMFAGAKRGSKTSVSGIGDEAFFTGVQNFVSLWVRKGTKYLLVRAYGLPASEGEAKLKA